MRTFSEEMHHRMTCENVLRHIDDIPNKWHDAYWDAPCNITWPLVKRSIGEAMPYCVINQSDMRLISNKPSRWRDFPTVCRALSVMRRPSVMWPSTMQCSYWIRHYLLKQRFPPQVNYHYKPHPGISHHQQSTTSTHCALLVVSLSEIRHHHPYYSTSLGRLPIQTRTSSIFAASCSTLSILTLPSPTITCEHVSKIYPWTHVSWFIPVSRLHCPTVQFPTIYSSFW